VSMPSLIDFRVRAPLRDTPPETPDIDPEIAPYGRLYDLEDNERLTADDLFAEVEKHDVQVVLQAEYETGASRPVNERVAQLVARRPDLVLGGIPSVDPREPDALSELQWAHDELGLRGWVFQPGFLQVKATDPRCFPLYAYCEKAGHPVTVHTGINFSRTGPIEYGRPSYIDEVACAFPDLTIVCNHGGWPWVMETIAVLWKHPNVLADFGAVAPKYMADASGGWGPMAHWMNTQLKHQVLLGTDWPMLHYERVIEELPLLGLSPASYDAYVRGNASRLIDRVWARG
jgi:predicted TIM-barrel fold metal-dependent hydrolase